VSLSEAVQLNAQAALVWCAVGNVYIRASQLRQAVHSYMCAIECDSTMIEAWQNYAPVLELDPDLRAQMSHFEARFPEMPVTIAQRSDGRRQTSLPILVEPND
jgi:hypothetical protein